MSGRLRFYRRRRALPFLAVACLVGINGATLAPFAVPAEPGGSASAGETARDTIPWRQCERGDDDARDASVVAAPPPVVKNLRRPAPARQVKAATGGHAGRPPDARGPAAEVLLRVHAANAADLTRLCRLLL